MVELKLSPEALALTSTPDGVERINIADRDQWLGLRGKDVTASNVAALFGQYEYFGRLGLWEIKTGRSIPPQEETWAMTLGNLLEVPAVERFATTKPDWTITPLRNRYYYRDPTSRIGATPDAFAIDPSRPGFGVIQIKTAGQWSESKWVDAGGSADFPTWVGLQAMTEAMLTGASWAAIVVLFIRNGRIIEAEVPIMPGLWDDMKSAVAEFWTQVESGTPPEADPDRDAKIIARIYAEDDGTQIDLTGDNRIVELVDRRTSLKDAERLGNEAEKERKAIDTEIIAKLGNATSAVLADGRVISAKTTYRKAYPVAASSYRTVKIGGAIAAPARATSTFSATEKF